jgi:hypothetical protein
MRDAFPDGMPEVAALADLLAHLTGELSRHGAFN